MRGFCAIQFVALFLPRAQSTSGKWRRYSPSPRLSIGKRLRQSFRCSADCSAVDSVIWVGKLSQAKKRTENKENKESIR